MKSFRFILLLSASVLLGAIVSGIITMTTWNIRIEDKAFHCWDIGFGSYWTDISSHASAGDTISAGWTWEKLRQVRLNYIETFWLLWAVISLITFLISYRLWPGPSPRPTPLVAGGPIVGRVPTLRHSSAWER